MNEDLQEQACWLLLVFESGLPTRIVNDILVIWCKQLGRSLWDFFAASAQEWSATCHLKPEIIQKLEQAKEKLAAQAVLVERLLGEHIRVVTVLDPVYPLLLKSALGRTHIPPILFCMGDLEILKRQTIAIIGARNANEQSLAFTRATACYFAAHGANVISGNARGVDRSAYEGAISTDGCTTVVLPHGIHRLSKVQLRDLQPRIEHGTVLLVSQFHPDAPWVVSRAMERNNAVTGLAQVVIVAEADSKGGTWEGANGALKQGRRLYVRQPDSTTLPGNNLLLEKGGRALSWPSEDLAAVLLPVLQEGDGVREKQQALSAPPDQLSLLIRTD
ncbi:MAG: DNA-protecting protein DprA [Chloroflexota bacterium]|nr:DNA-protecting protein DprA [Chloroflexota bacterium]